MRFFQLPFLFAVVVLFFLVGSVSGEEEREFKVASVNVQKVFQEFFKTRKAEEQINEARISIEKADNKVKVRMKVLGDQIEDVRARINSGELKVEEVEAQEAKLKRLVDQGVELNKEREMRYAQSNQQLNQDMIKTMRGILAEIRRFASDHAVSADYDVVFDVSGNSSNQTPPVLFGRNMVDITSILIAELNKEVSNPEDGR